MTRPLAALALVPLLIGGGAWAVAAQDETEGFLGSSCPVPEEGADVMICPEETIVNGNGSFAGIEVFVRDERHGWTQMTPCDGVVVACEPVYARADIDSQGSSFEITLDDDPGDGEPQS